jgi:hypothetical protein
MTQIKANDPRFDCEAFTKEAREKLKLGQPLMGESGILTPLIKKIGYLFRRTVNNRVMILGH